MYDDAIIMPKSQPRLRRVDEIDRCPHPLFLDAERRDFEEARWIDARYPRLNWRSAPAIDPHGRTRLDLDRIGRQEVGYDLQVTRIADLDQWRAGLDDRFALLNDLKHATGDGCADLHAADRIVQRGRARRIDQSGGKAPAYALPDLDLRFGTCQSRFVRRDLEFRLVQRLRGNRLRACQGLRSRKLVAIKGNGSLESLHLGFRIFYVAVGRCDGGLDFLPRAEIDKTWRCRPHDGDHRIVCNHFVADVT